MEDVGALKNCNCPSDCESVRYSILEKEVSIDPDDYCATTSQDGRLLLSRYSDHQFSLNYERIPTRNFSGPEAMFDNTYQIEQQKNCFNMMKNDIAIVKVQLESSKYIKTIMDRRSSFSDKLAAFGK